MDTREQDIVRQVESLIIDMWWAVDLDLRDESAASRFFTQDALFDLGSKPLVGRAEIDSFYAARRARGIRTTRHVISNLAVTVEAGTASARYIMQIYGADGAPVLPSKPPILLCDVVDHLVQMPDGEWLIASHVLDALFESGTIVRPQ